MNPESIPSASFTQGSAKADSVTVWFCDMKVKTTISPTAAEIDSGE
jgi:hypothetical protein